MMILYSCALLLVLLLGLPYWLLRMATSGKYRAGLGERLGRVPRRLKATVAGKPVVWLHAVSVGEVLAASRLVQELESALPGHVLVVSTTTRTGQQLARERFGAGRVFYFPLDFSVIVRQYLDALRPSMLVLMETEFWPNVLAECARSQVPVAVVNARISDRSLPRYRRLRFLWRGILATIDLFLAQSDEDAQRLVNLGVAADRVRVSGNLKFDVRVAGDTALTVALREHLLPNARLLVCGSTLEGEEQALLECLPALMAACPTLVMVLAPRHPERFEPVVKLLNASGAQWVRRSEWVAAPDAIRPGTVLLLDSIGELAAVYGLATVAFVGGSLFGAGGHNPLEPAQFGVPVVMGESYENFRGIVAAMLAEKAICVVQPEQLCAVLRGMLLSEADAQSMGARGRAVFRSQAGATARTVQALLTVLSAKGAA